MAFESIEIAPHTYHLQSGANSGLIVADEQAIVIDVGLDDDAGKKIKKTIESLNVKLAALIITHGHADHFGGAAYLRRTLPSFDVYAPTIEAAIVENPILEGIMLSGGAIPFDALTGKFTLAQPCKVDHLISLESTALSIAGVDLTVVRLHGHSPQQIGIQYGNVLFCADAFLPIATLSKYPIPFTVHIGQALAVLQHLRTLVTEGVILAPGHGTHLIDPAEANTILDANETALQRLIDTVYAITKADSSDEGSITQLVAQQLGDPLASPVSYYLARTAVQAALVYLYEQKRAGMHSKSAGHIGWAAIN